MAGEAKAGFTAYEFFEAPSKWELRRALLNLLDATTSEMLKDENFNLRWLEAQKLFSDSVTTESHDPQDSA